jgi:hypothetical protein
MASESRDPGALDQEALRERHALEDYRKAMWDAADAVRDRMRLELDAAHHPQHAELEAQRPAKRRRLPSIRRKDTGSPDSTT